MLIVDAYRNLLETSVSIAKKFHVSDSHAHDVFNRYVKLDRLSEWTCPDEIYKIYPVRHAGECFS